MDPDNSISCVVKEISFDDTLREMDMVIEGELSGDRRILVNSIEMYEVI